VREVGLKEAGDSIIWTYAKQNGFVIVSKDSDFQQRSLLFGHPPKFVWLRVGNCPVSTIENLLRKYAAALRNFEQNDQESHLMLS
jgi:predicted nuclease of predicted toxin-antitoxin system